VILLYSFDQFTIIITLKTMNYNQPLDKKMPSSSRSTCPGTRLSPFPGCKAGAFLTKGGSLN